VTPYNSKNKTSGVIAYKIGKDRITVKFRNNEIYTYTDSLCLKEDIETMKALALASEGLSTFIAQNRNRLKFID
jgi:hypothetical protein